MAAAGQGEAWVVPYTGAQGGWWGPGPPDIRYREVYDQHISDIERCRTPDIGYREVQNHNILDIHIHEKIRYREVQDHHILNRDTQDHQILDMERYRNTIYK